MSSIALGWLSALAFAGGIAPAEPGPQPVAGGAEVAACGWPTTVRLTSNCSGTLIHPQVVVYAAHCGTGQTQVTVGEIEAEGTAYATDECWQSPDWNGNPGGTDFAVCRLVEPVPDVAIVPIMMGCELQMLAKDVEVTSLGFGNSPDGPNGIKRAVTFPIVGVDWDMNTVAAGGDTGTLCSGDSGGGTFVPGLDGSWRLFGVNSAVAGSVCESGPAILGIIADVVPWIEEQTGFDVSPCYAADGTWDPDDRCAQVPIDPASGGGAWPACEAGPLSEALSTCGVPVEGEDLAAPMVTIAMPADGEVIPVDGGGGSASIFVSIEVDDGDGFGVAGTHLRIDGADIDGTEDDWVPFEVPGLAFPAGSYTLEAVATDWAGNEAVSAPVQIMIGDEAPGGDTTDEGGADETDGGAGTDAVEEDGTGSPPEDDGDDEPGTGDGTGSASGAADGDDGTRGCTVGARPAPIFLLGGLCLVALRRRRGG